jgi:hypothetical protein
VLFVKIFRIKKKKKSIVKVLIGFKKFSEANSAFLFFHKEKHVIKNFRIFLLKRVPKIPIYYYIENDVIRKAGFKIFIYKNFLKDDDLFNLFTFFGSYPLKSENFNISVAQTNGAFFNFYNFFDAIYSILSIEGESIFSTKITIKNQENFHFHMDFCRKGGDNRKFYFHQFLKNSKKKKKNYCTFENIDLKFLNRQDKLCELFFLLLEIDLFDTYFKDKKFIKFSIRLKLKYSSFLYDHSFDFFEKDLKKKD